MDENYNDEADAAVAVDDDAPHATDNVHKDVLITPRKIGNSRSGSQQVAGGHSSDDVLGMSQFH